MARPVEAASDSGTACQPSRARPVHGGIKPEQLRALGLKPDEVLDFSASVSPLGPPPGLEEALRGVDLTAYPDPACLELREALAGHLSGSQAGRITPEQVLPGNGSTELIHLLARAFLAPPDFAPKEDGASPEALLLTPTYGEYRGACLLAGGAVSELEADRERGFRWDLAEARRRIARTVPTTIPKTAGVVEKPSKGRPSLVFLCNPNNPTGVYLAHNEVEALAQACAEAGALLVVDEAYLNFVDSPWDSLDLLEGGHTVLLRSMTKDYALTGLRLGYSLASPEVTARLASFQPDWSVNSLAQAAGRAALADRDYLSRTREAVNAAKEYLIQGLGSMGFIIHPSAANFLLIEVGDGGWWEDQLMHRGIFVRDCASFGLPDCIRIGIRAQADCEKLVAAVAQEKRPWPVVPAGS
ncbi:MAG: histidinol-phosphate aminotransferase family protein [Chloroflexi bacterium]|nr:histidinol-phosphate aminotransferase family protein [Chloroflexota bacterium]